MIIISNLHSGTKLSGWLRHWFQVVDKRSYACFRENIHCDNKLVVVNEFITDQFFWFKQQKIWFCCFDQILWMKRKFVSN